MTTDAQGRERRGVYLPLECWEWLEVTAEHDASSVNDLLEGLVLLAKDRSELPYWMLRSTPPGEAAAGWLAALKPPT